MKRRAIIAVIVVLVLGSYATWQFGLLERWGLIEAKSKTLALYGNVDIRQVELGGSPNCASRKATLSKKAICSPSWTTGLTWMHSMSPRPTSLRAKPI